MELCEPDEIASKSINVKHHSHSRSRIFASVEYSETFDLMEKCYGDESYR
jgi:hypothetical protein